ncbi:MAG: lysostaphin resistance A-like protein [Gemmatimonadota bacterium]
MRFGFFVVLFLVLQELLHALLLPVARNGWVLSSAATLAAAVIAGLLLLRALERRPGAALGFPLVRSAWRQLVIGTALGVSGLFAACALLVVVGALRFAPDSGSFVPWLRGMLGMLALLLVPAAAEEALFRGYPFQKLVEGFGAPIATVVASVAFAIAHADNPSAGGFALLNICAAGVLLSVAYLTTSSLWFATGVHVGWNWAMAALLDLPVSGLELFDAPLYEPVAKGPIWLTGGAFGPEGGVAGLIGLLLVLGGVLWITRKKAEWVTSTPLQ